MRRILGLSLVLVVFAAACGSSGGTSPTGTKGADSQATATATVADAGNGSTGANNNGTNCGSGKYLTYTTTTFCGSAKATVKVGSNTYELTQGVCVEEASVGWAISVGTTVIGAADLSADAPLYFGVVQQPNEKAMATGLLGGKGFVVSDGSGSDKVTIAADKKSGSVNGTDFDGNAIVASFTC